MRYIWTEDTGAGLHFWNLVNQILFDNKIVIESKAIKVFWMLRMESFGKAQSLVKNNVCVRDWLLLSFSALNKRGLSP